MPRSGSARARRFFSRLAVSVRSSILLALGVDPFGIPWGYSNPFPLPPETALLALAVLGSTTLTPETVVDILALLEDGTPWEEISVYLRQ